MVAAVVGLVGIAPSLPSLPPPWGRDGRRGAAGAEGSPCRDGGRRPRRGRGRSRGAGAGDGFPGRVHFSSPCSRCFFFVKESKEKVFFFCLFFSFLRRLLIKTHIFPDSTPPALVPVPIKLERPWYVPPVFDPQIVSAAESERRASAKEHLGGGERKQKGEASLLLPPFASGSLSPSAVCCRPHFPVPRGSSGETPTSILESRPEA